jgi:hypothetical protein
MISKYERGSRSVIRHCAERKKITTIIPITQSNRAASTVTPNTRSREREMAEASRIPNRMNGIVTGSGFAGAASPIGGIKSHGLGPNRTIAATNWSLSRPNWAYNSLQGPLKTLTFGGIMTANEQVWTPGQK